MPLTGPQPVEATESFTHADGADIRLVLRLPDAGELFGESVPVRLRFAKTKVWSDARVTRQDPGVLLEARISRAQLPPRVWRIALVPDGGSPVRVQARLLTSDKQPVALLPGPTPATRIAPPRPRSTTGNDASGARRTVGRLVGTVRSALPAERAAEYGASLRKLVRPSAR